MDKIPHFDLLGKFAQKTFTTIFPQLLTDGHLVVIL